MSESTITFTSKLRYGTNEMEVAIHDDGFSFETENSDGDRCVVYLDYEQAKRLCEFLEENK